MSTLASFKDIHKGETIIVCGCGSSLNDLVHPERFITIGVNDVGRRFHPNYLVVVNPRRQFKDGRFNYIRDSQSEYLFTHLDLGTVQPQVVRFRLGKRGGTVFTKPNVLNYTQNSPYVALCLAAHMGAKRIGLIGVDFTDHHFFSKTGRHVLNNQLARIDAEYKALEKALARQGIEVINLSEQSRLTAFKKGSMENEDVEKNDSKNRVNDARRRGVFFVNYKFLSCGDVFKTGLIHAAEELDIRFAEAYWDDHMLPAKIKTFNPDLVLVVHGRRFSRRWKNTFKNYNTAVWLLDEPYEVDDTVTFSKYFDTVFVNDPNTLDRHENAHYLPVCFDPRLYFAERVAPAAHDVAKRHSSQKKSSHENKIFTLSNTETGQKKYEVGFIGGYNPVRQGMLTALKDEGLLSYVVGGPWRGGKLNPICLAKNIPAHETAKLYRQTKITVNVFRSQHHFNKKNIPAFSMNPRIYEALACGSLVVSEDRPEIRQVFPGLPVFENKAQLVDILKKLGENDDELNAILRDCKEKLEDHTYSRRLEKVIEIAIDKKSARDNEKIIAPVQEQVELKTGIPEYSIIMVVHNALQVVKMSILRTLRHIAGHDARLIVVDNASTDGTGEWLDVLARRGDIRLIRAKQNIGHGPGIELARRDIRSPFIVTLDSDAFPLAEDWLPRLRSRLNDKVKITGILHHRDYIHPSCLMIARETVEDFNLSFLNEKDKPVKLDVAERMSLEVKRRGLKIAGLKKSSARRRGSVSEPVYLGSNYEGLVYHQWYTTRAVISGGHQVDDVPGRALERSLQEVLDEFANEVREVTVVVGVRAEHGQPQRIRNARAVLWALNLQALRRWEYRIIVVEQDSEPVLEKILEPLCDRYIFAYNPGPYNRSWAFNIGAVRDKGKTGALCFLDADLLVPEDFLSRGLAEMKSGQKAVSPYREVVYLDPASTVKAIADRVESSKRIFDIHHYRGTLFTTSQGGTIWVEPGLYFDIGGHNEEFCGWGCEDREFWHRLEKHVPIKRLSGRLLHLQHPEPDMNGALAAANRKLYRKLSARSSRKPPHSIGDPDRYNPAKPRLNNEIKEAAKPVRDWENWHRWTSSRIENILLREKHQNNGKSVRQRLVEELVQLGSNMLDLGCGTGALQLYLNRYRPDFPYVGVDITYPMVKTAQRFFPQVPLLQADAGHLPFAAGSFDVVVLRHVLEHLPAWLMERALEEAMRVSLKSIALVFYLPPVFREGRKVRRVGENFLETQWPVKDIENIAAKKGWRLHTHFEIYGAKKETDTVWILKPEGIETADTAKDSLNKRPRKEERMKISIVMPTYKRPHTLPRTIETIRNQTYGNWELIIIDNDGSNEYRFDDPRIRVFRHATRASASYARNRGLQYATGDLICFFDDDDNMFPDYLKCFVTAFQKNRKAKMARGGMVVSGGRINYSYATPECCLRREFATPTWLAKGPAQDQRYFKQIVLRNRWSEKKGDIVVIHKALCKANSDRSGGLRQGNY